MNLTSWAVCSHELTHRSPLSPNTWWKSQVCTSPICGSPGNCLNQQQDVHFVCDTVSSVTFSNPIMLTVEIQLPCCGKPFPHHVSPWDYQHVRLVQGLWSLWQCSADKDGLSLSGFVLRWLTSHRFWKLTLFTCVMKLFHKHTKLTAQHLYAGRHQSAHQLLPWTTTVLPTHHHLTKLLC